MDRTAAMVPLLNPSRCIIPRRPISLQNGRRGFFSKKFFQIRDKKPYVKPLIRQRRLLSPSTVGLTPEVPYASHITGCFGKQ